VVFHVALKTWENWKMSNDLSKVTSWSNLLKDKILNVEIEAHLLVENLFIEYKKNFKFK